MISIEQVQKAIKMLDNPKEYLNCDAIHKQLASSLELYQDRKEFGGSLESAIECLELAGYEILSIE